MNAERVWRGWEDEEEAMGAVGEDEADDEERGSGMGVG